MDGFWFDKTRMDTTSCAIPANIGVPGTAMCWCAGIPAALTAEWGYCLSPRTPYPQQVNIQYGSSDRELQIAFVTEDFDLPVVSPPIVEVCVVGDAGCFNVTGRSTRVPEPQLPSRILTFSFVPLPTSLTLPGAHFTYRALPGTSPADWSEAFLVTLPPPQQRERTYALFGDQGLYPYSSVGNLLSDLAGGKIDSVIHLGDLAYNMEMGNGSRGDGYMYALEPLLSKIPWVPTMGNHEIEGSPFGVYCNSSVYCEGRYLNQTGGYLVAGNASGSGTNLYYSLDLGLLHLVVVNTMPYLGLRADLRDRQMEWLEADLAAASHPAQRASVPWIVVASHVPMYCSANGEEHVGDEAKQDLEPLLYKYGVDLYTYGHVHGKWWWLFVSCAARQCACKPHYKTALFFSPHTSTHTYPCSYFQPMKAPGLCSTIPFCRKICLTRVQPCTC